MQFTTASALLLALASGALAAPWAKSADGVWVANNEWQKANWDRKQINCHQACTKQGQQDQAQDQGTPCAYWTNGQGGQLHGSKSSASSRLPSSVGYPGVALRLTRSQPVCLGTPALTTIWIVLTHTALPSQDCRQVDDKIQCHPVRV